MLSTKMKMSLLVATHVVAGVVLTSASKEFTGDLSIPSAAKVALIFADAGLVGIWGGLSKARFVGRLLVLPGAIFYLWAILSFDTDPDFVEYLIIAFPTVALVMVLFSFRYSQFRLRLALLPNVSQLPQGFQFSIRSLLLATATVAIVLGIGRTVYAISDNYPYAVYFMMFPLCIIVVELATLWGTLGKGSSLLRLAFIVPLSFCIGTIPIFYLGELEEVELLMMAHFSSIFGLQAIFTAASLLVVRSCGWRLVSGATSDGMRSDGNDAATLEAVSDKIRNGE